MLCRHGTKNWSGSDPECGFDEEGKFREENWMCFLVQNVRDLMNQWNSPEDKEYCPTGHCWWDDDSYVGVLYIPYSMMPYTEMISPLTSSMVIMTWYKSRGRTDSFRILGGDGTLREGNESDAVEILRIFSKYHNYDNLAQSIKKENK